MRIAFRTDSSLQIGTGHLRRCLSLAQALAEQGAEVVLVVRQLDGVAGHVLKGGGFPVHWLPAPTAGDATDADGPPHRDWAQVPWRRDAEQTADALGAQPPQWLVVDHYAFDARWHDKVRTALGCRLLVIDDVADRALSPDALLDQNWAPDHRAKYRGRLTREPAAWLTGPRYALLSAAYRDAPRYRFNPQIRSIGVFMGGTDPDGASARALRCLREEVGFDGPVEVASTSANPHLPELRAACAASPGTTLTLDQPELASFFARHDLQIGAGGGATWERCCIGAPTLALTLAENQRSVLTPLASLDVLTSIDDIPPSDTAMRAAIGRLFGAPELRERLSRNSKTLVDGRGPRRIANLLAQV
jgi:UDP-2,4-diacetamido-2,4,6-trideoxy-beta-L-altropyranose hydrolase